MIVEPQDTDQGGFLVPKEFRTNVLLWAIHQKEPAFKVPVLEVYLCWKHQVEKMSPFRHWLFMAAWNYTKRHRFVTWLSNPWLKSDRAAYMVAVRAQQEHKDYAVEQKYIQLYKN